MKGLHVNHSPEPWRYELREHSGSLGEYDIVVDASGAEIVEVGNPNHEDGSYPDMRPQDAERIVACVNFCRHLATEFLDLHTACEDQGVSPAENKHAMAKSCWPTDPDFVGFIPVTAPYTVEKP
jgi:hypothetical protein